MARPSIYDSHLYKRLRFTISRGLLILLGLLIAAVALEIALRIFPIPNRFTLTRQLLQQWESDDELLLHLKPNLDLRITGHPEFNYRVRTNDDGLRDEPFEGTFDIAAIGDSFTFGFGVEEPDSWPTRLEAMSGTGVANLGWAGWNSYVYPSTVRRYAIPLQTRIWIWAYFANDLPESASAEAFITSGQTDYKTVSTEDNASFLEQPFPFNLQSIQLLAAIINPELFLLPNSGNILFDNGELRMRVSQYAWEVTDTTQPEVRRGWELTEAALLETQQLASEHDASLVVVFIPSREHVYWPYIQDTLPGVSIQQLDETEARLAEFSDAHDIAYLNLLPGFRAQAMQDDNLLYFAADGHWNEQGHDLAAHLIYNKLLQEKLLAAR